MHNRVPHLKLATCVPIFDRSLPARINKQIKKKREGRHCTVVSFGAFRSGLRAFSAHGVCVVCFFKFTTSELVLSFSATVFAANLWCLGT